MRSCTRCQRQLPTAVSEFGLLHAPLCWSCWWGQQDDNVCLIRDGTTESCYHCRGRRTLLDGTVCHVCAGSGLVVWLICPDCAGEGLIERDCACNCPHCIGNSSEEGCETCAGDGFVLRPSVRGETLQMALLKGLA